MFFLFLVASLVPPVSMLRASDHQAGLLVAVFSPLMPAADAMASVVRAGGLPVQQGSSANIMIAKSQSLGFAGRLRSEGAWFVTDLQVLYLCGQRPDLVTSDAGRSTAGADPLASGLDPAALEQATTASTLRRMSDRHTAVSMRRAMQDTGWQAEPFDHLRQG